jgi:hypothetical protein
MNKLLFFDPGDILLGHRALYIHVRIDRLLVLLGEVRKESMHGCADVVYVGNNYKEAPNIGLVLIR